MFYSNDEVMFSAGAVVFDQTREHVLALVDSRSGKEELYFPKGRVEPNETNQQAAIREVREETGAMCTLLAGQEPMGVEVRFSAAINKTKIIYWYVAELVEMGPQDLQGNEQFTVRWIHAKDAGQELSFDEDKKLLTKCIQILQ